ncbi:terminase large subunit [Listeria portnoyi]|uniref:terminase large subunit n=1 Tax=Listeria portnoyi TaxID=2713504 RepID=UPI001C9C9CE1|nr:terminase TerL endonuclease subunit [Listeria portnoyi]
MGGKDIAYVYAKKVLSGDIVASKKVKAACKRHLNDLEQAEKGELDYVYMPEYADKVIRFIETLPDVKTGETFPLVDFQKFIVSMLYGWREQHNTKARRFKKAFISMARKNGKSILVAGIALYEFLFGSEPAYSRQIYCTANDKNQSKIVFDMIRKQLEKLRSKYFEIEKMTKRVREELQNREDESYIRPLSRDTGAIDGFEAYVGILDEFAASKTDEMLELLESSQGQLDNPLILIISTAGFNLNGPMYKTEYPYASKILLEDYHLDDEYFAYIAEQDTAREIKNPDMWVKSNPLLAIPEQRDKVMKYLNKRLKAGFEKGTINKVYVKNFNIWRQSEEESYMTAENWEKAKIEKTDIHGRRAWIGVDVGRTSDLYAISWLTMNEEMKRWEVDSFSFVATKYGLDTKIKRDSMDYQLLEEKGECQITKLESGVIDNEAVFEWLEDFILSNDLLVEGICYDPYQFGDMLTRIEKTYPEWPLIEVRQGTRTLSMPTKQFKDDVLNGKVMHMGNQLLSAAVHNAILESNNNGVRIDKSKNSNKIDPLDALLDAYAICFLEEFTEPLDDDYIMNGNFSF